PCRRTRDIAARTDDRGRGRRGRSRSPPPTRSWGGSSGAGRRWPGRGRTPRPKRWPARPATGGGERRRNGSSAGEGHLLQDRAPEQAVRIGESLDDLEVVVPLADEEGRRLAGGPDRGREVARLPLELRRLERALGDDDGRVEPVEAALGGWRVPPSGRSR